MARVVLDRVSKYYGRDTAAVRDLSLDVADGEFVVLVGPSGCGKSTTLRMIAGLEDVSGGTISIGDKVVTGLPPGQRDIAMVFQQPATLPQLDVAGNLGFGLRLRHRPKTEIAKRVSEVAELLEIGHLLARRPHELSGGERQRVAIGRAMLREPAAFLMDEPLSSLDAHLRIAMRGEIASLQRRLGATTLYVTHDQAEAMTLGDRVGVMRDGVIEQIGRPIDLYDRPATQFVAGFLGLPPMNLLPGRTVSAGVRCGDLVLPVPAGVATVGEDVVVGVRPTDLFDASAEPQRGTCIEVVVDLVEHLGAEVLVYFVVGSTRCTASLDRRTDVAPGGRLRLGIDPANVHVFDAVTGRARGN